MKDYEPSGYIVKPACGDIDIDDAMPKESDRIMLGQGYPVTRDWFSVKYVDGSTIGDRLIKKYTDLKVIGIATSDPLGEILNFINAYYYVARYKQAVIDWELENNKKWRN